MDPLSLVPFAMAAADGRVDGWSVSALVAAGVSVLQRSPRLVRTLLQRRTAILAHAPAAWVVALAASDGRELVVLDAAGSPESLRTQVASYDVGAVFTSGPTARRRAAELPAPIVTIDLDDLPRTAQLTGAEWTQQVDLGSHFGLPLVGDTAADGSPAPCLIWASTATVLTHREALATARASATSRGLTPLHRVPWPAPPQEPNAFASGLLAPLLVGASIVSAE